MIHREAVLHIPLSQYAYAPDEARLTIRLRAAQDNLTACTLYYGDRAQDSDPIRFTPSSMAVVSNDGLFDYFEITFTPGIERVCYYFALTSADEMLLYCADLFMIEVPPARSEFYQYPYLRREEISDVPAWFKEAVVYNIFPDSFANDAGILSSEGQNFRLESGAVSKSKLGGTLRGITANLAYIKDLGFNCVYLNPIFTAGEYHKYDLIDYFHIDPCFGTDADFAELVETAHGMGLRVIIDGVFNHCGCHFFAFEDVVKNGRDSAYVDWFYGLEFPVVVSENGERPGYSCFGYEPKMPKLNTSNPATRDYFMKVCRHWTRDYHIDGWRLDVANEVDREFWRAFRRTAKAENPDCVLIAEIWESSESWLRGDMFDSTMNYDFRKHCRDFFALSAIDAASFNARTTQMLMRYPTGIVQGQLNLLDSHDVSRFLSLCGGDERRFKLAVLFLAIFPGVPSVFYGDELSVTGLEEPEYRQAMPWGSGSNMAEFFRQVMKLRRNPAVTRGDYKVLYTQKGAGVYAIERTDGTHTVTLLLNAGETSVEVDGLAFPSQTPFMERGWEISRIDGFGYALWVGG
jgi:glycosidase